MIQGGTTNSPISAIPAAISTKTTLLLGLWASVPQEVFNNEVAALSAAIKQYGTAFTDLIVGISVGSEDLYRISPTGILNKSGVGAEPATLVSYIEQTRKAIAGTGASSKPVGHVETWNDWTNGSNSAVVQACDFLGMDAYPYFEGTKQNAIADGVARFSDALSATRAAAQGKPVWVTETGWPVSGETVNQAVPSVNNAKAYWQQVGCKLFGSVNTWWYTLQDAAPDTPSPSFGIVGSTLTTTPIYELTCPAGQTGTDSLSSGPPSASPPASSPDPIPSSPPSSASTAQSSAAGSSGSGSSGSNSSGVFSIDNFASTARPSGSGSPSTSAGGSATSAGSGTGAGASATGGGSGAPRSTSSASVSFKSLFSSYILSRAVISVGVLVFS